MRRTQCVNVCVRTVRSVRGAVLLTNLRFEYTHTYLLVQITSTQRASTNGTLHLIRINFTHRQFNVARMQWGRKVFCEKQTARLGKSGSQTEGVSAEEVVELNRPAHKQAASTGICGTDL